MAAGLVIQDPGAGAGRPYQAAEAIAIGEMVALDASGYAMVANAIVGADHQVPTVGIAMHAAALGEQVEVKHLGEVEDADAAFTEGRVLYLAETDGDVTETIPTTSGDSVQVVGMTLTSTIWRLDISPTYTTL